MSVKRTEGSNTSRLETPPTEEVQNRALEEGSPLETPEAPSAYQPGLEARLDAPSSHEHPMSMKQFAVPTLTAVEALLAKPTGKSEEKKVLAHLQAASPSELDAVMRKVDIDRLLDAMDDRWFGPDNHKAALHLLTQERIGDLGTEARARFVTALQKGKTTKKDELAIRDIMVATHGTALTELKNRIDLGGDHRDLHQLVYHDIDDDEVRDAILTHIQTEANSIPAQGNKLLSDIDDTIYANWKDKRYPKKTVYPGVRQFQLEIGGAPNPETPAPQVTFLTARPAEPTGELEEESLESLAQKGFVDAAMLSGSITHLTNNAIAEQKQESFLRYAPLFPEYKFVFVGDSGQGDASAATQMGNARPDDVRGLFIHKVDVVTEAEQSEWTAHGIHTFDTYAGAAAAACAAGLIDQSALRRVAEATVADITEISFESDAQKGARMQELGADLAKVNALLAPGSPVELNG